MGARLFIHHWSPHDVEQPWGADHVDGIISDLETRLRNDARVSHLSLDLRDADAADVLIEQARSTFSHLDILVCNHARSGGDGALADTSAETLDAPGRSIPGRRCWPPEPSPTSTTVEKVGASSG